MRITHYDIQTISNFINDKQLNRDYKKTTFILDIDNIIIDIFNDNIYLNIDDYRQILTVIIESVFYLIGSIKNTIPNSSVIIVSSYAEDYNRLKLNYEYKKKNTNRRKNQLKIDPKIIELLSNYSESNIIIDDNNSVTKYTRRFLYGLLNNIVNVAIKNSLWFHIKGIETDYVIYYLLNTYYSNETLYFIISNDKDYIQLLTKPNIYIYRKTSGIKQNPFTNEKIKIRDITIYNKNNIKDFFKKYTKFEFDYALDLVLWLSIYGDTSDSIKTIYKKFDKVVLDILGYDIKTLFKNIIQNKKERHDMINIDDYLNYIYDGKINDIYKVYDIYEDYIKLISLEKASNLSFTTTDKQNIVNILKLKNSYKNEEFIEQLIYQYIGLLCKLPEKLCE